MPFSLRKPLGREGLKVYHSICFSIRGLACNPYRNSLFLMGNGGTRETTFIDARAKKFGWQDTYIFTKAMGEMIVDSMRDDLPTVIIRPSIVESSLKEPFPGWIEGNRYYISFTFLTYFH